MVVATIAEMAAKRYVEHAGDYGEGSALTLITWIEDLPVGFQRIRNVRTPGRITESVFASSLHIRDAIAAQNRRSYFSGVLKAIGAKLEVERLIGDGVISSFFRADKPKARRLGG
jgi:hypothetical protein